MSAVLKHSDISQRAVLCSRMPGRGQGLLKNPFKRTTEKTKRIRFCAIAN